MSSSVSLAEAVADGLYANADSGVSPALKPSVRRRLVTFPELCCPALKGEGSVHGEGLAVFGGAAGKNWGVCGAISWSFSRVAKSLCSSLSTRFWSWACRWSSFVVGARRGVRGV